MGFGSIDDAGLQEKLDNIKPSGQAIVSVPISDGVPEIDGEPIADMPETLLPAHVLTIRFCLVTNL